MEAFEGVSGGLCEATRVSEENKNTKNVNRLTNLSIINYCTKKNVFECRHARGKLIGLLGTPKAGNVYELNVFAAYFLVLKKTAICVVDQENPINALESGQICPCSLLWFLKQLERSGVDFQAFESYCGEQNLKYRRIVGDGQGDLRGAAEDAAFSRNQGPRLKLLELADVDDYKPQIVFKKSDFCGSKNVFKL